MNPGRIQRLMTTMLAFVLVFMYAACDNEGGDDTSDAERIVGSWDLAGVEDESGDRTADFAATFQSFDATFNADGTVNLVLDRTDPNDDDVNLLATYAVDETAMTVTLTVQTLAIPFSYEFVSDDTVELTASATLMNLVFQTTLQGQSTITLQRD